MVRMKWLDARRTRKNDALLRQIGRDPDAPLADWSEDNEAGITITWLGNPRMGDIDLLFDQLAEIAHEHGKAHGYDALCSATTPRRAEDET